MPLSRVNSDDPNADEILTPYRKMLIKHAIEFKTLYAESCEDIRISPPDDIYLVSLDWLKKC